MKHKDLLRELSKFGAGLVVGDFIGLVWLVTSGLLPLPLWGVTFTLDMASFGMLFDILLFLLLLHYGWRAEVHMPSMRQKTFFKVVGVILALITILHLIRALFNLPLTLGGWSAPLSFSWVGTLVAGYLAYTSLRFGNEKHWWNIFS